MSKVDPKKDKKVVQDYIQHIEDRIGSGQEVADMNFAAMTALYEMAQKVQGSQSEDARVFWAKNLSVFRDTIQFIDKMYSDLNKVNSYNEYNYELNQKLAAKNKELKEENERLTKVLEQKYL